MIEPDVLQHLLEVEAEAAGLVDAAQTEADKRIAETESRNRTAYEEGYAKEIAALDAEYTQKIAAIKADHQAQLDEYRQSFAELPLHQDSFSQLAASLLGVAG